MGTGSPTRIETRDGKSKREFSKNKFHDKRDDVLRERRIGAERSRLDASERRGEMSGDDATDNRTASGTKRSNDVTKFRAHDGSQKERNDTRKSSSKPTIANLETQVKSQNPVETRNAKSRREFDKSRFHDERSRLDDSERDDGNFNRTKNANSMKNREIRNRLMAKIDPIRRHGRHRDNHQEKQSETDSKGKTQILCVNNKHDPRLRDSRYTLGTSGQCISKGFGSAMHQRVEDRRDFIRKFDAPYEKIINLDSILWYKNSDPPAGRHRATLPMCFQKGFGAGSAALAKKLKAQG